MALSPRCATGASGGFLRLGVEKCLAFRKNVPYTIGASAASDYKTSRKEERNETLYSINKYRIGCSTYERNS